MANSSTATSPEYAKGTYDAKMQDRNPDAFFNVAEQANDRMGDFLMKLSALTDQLCGDTPPSPEKNTSAGLRSVPNGLFGGAADNCSQICLKLEHANRLIDRIRSAL